MSALGMRPKYDSVKFEKKGDGAKGTIVEFDDVQMTKWKSNPPVPLFWDEAKTRPKMQTRVTIETAPGVESSRVNIWVKPGDQAKAVRDALVAVGARDIEVGAEFGCWMTGTREGQGAQPAKTYRAEYEPPFDPTA